jgi:hypothetical protein
MSFWIPTILRGTDKTKILAAADALKVFNGHDSYANLNYRYGQKWWDKITEIEKDLRDLCS